MRQLYRAAQVAVVLGLLTQTVALAYPNESDPKPETEDRYRDEITVVEEGERTLTVPSLQEAQKEMDAIPGGVAVVDAETYQQGRVATLKDALEFTPGVSVQPRFGSEETRLSIRGSGLQRTFHGRGLRLLQDGVPLNLADGSFDFQAVEPLAARYIEVFRGANALEHGSATLGGAINYVSRNGRDSGPFQVRTESGSFGYLRGQASAGFAGDRFDGFATVTHSSQDGYRVHSEQNNQRFLGNLGYRPSDAVESRFYLAGFHSLSELPGNLTRAELAADPRRAAAGNLALDQQRNFDLLRLSNLTTVLLGADSSLDLGGFWAIKDLDHPIFQVIDQRSNDLGAELRYENSANLWGRTNRLVFGLSPAVGKVHDNRFRNVAGNRGARTAQGVTTSTNVDFYAEDRHELHSRLSVSLGLQTSYARRDFADDFRNDGDQSDLQTFRGWSPKLGLLFQATPAVSLFANLSRSFEPPTFGELVNVGGNGLLALDAQSATTFELGSRGTARWLSWDVALYSARIANELLSLNDPQGNPLGTVNADRTRHSGAEVGLEGRWQGDRSSLRVRQSTTGAASSSRGTAPSATTPWPASPSTSCGPRCCSSTAVSTPAPTWSGRPSAIRWTTPTPCSPIPIRPSASSWVTVATGASAVSSRAGTWGIAPMPRPPA